MSADPRKSPSGRLVTAVLVLTATYYTGAVLWRHSVQGRTFPSHDFYAIGYPNLLYAGRSLLEGRGLLWNPYQACGEPFFAISVTGLLYPLKILYAVFDRDLAFLVDIALHLVIAAGGVLLLCRRIGLSMTAALCGALAFQLNWATLFLSTWSPVLIDGLAWLPVAMWQTERLVGVPSARRAVGLAVILTLQMLLGYHQLGYFTYQLIGLRIVWAVVARQSQQPFRLIASAAVGCLLPVLLAAVQLVPSIELARESIRSLPLTAADIGPPINWRRLPATLAEDFTFPGSAVGLVFALLAFLRPRRGDRAWGLAFFATVAAVYFVLSLGPGTPLYALYEGLPLGTAFRGAGRLRWVTSFALAVLIAFSCEAILTRDEKHSPWWMRARVGILLVAALLCLVPVMAGLRWSDAMLLGALAAAVSASYWSRSLVVPRLMLPLVIVINCVVFGNPPVFSVVHGDVYGTHAAVFERLRGRMTAQDRVLIVGGFPGLELTPKLASVIRVPSIYDYEAQTPLRYAEFFTFMRTGRLPQRASDWHWLFGKMLLEPLRRPLFDVLGTRYVVIDPSLDRVPAVLGSGMRLVQDSPAVRVYENERVLPRARYVPRIAVVAADQVLPRMAAAGDAVRHQAWVSETPRSGFLGSPEPASGTVEQLTDRAEQVVLRVSATAPGFLFLADQYFPGWTARVNGGEQDIIRANHAFRLVEVPAGVSEVVFTYRPTSLRVGALVTIATIATLVVWWRRSRWP